MLNLDDLARRWREEAEILKRWGAVNQASALEFCAREFESFVEDWDFELLTIKEAAAESGYSEAHLRRLVRAGQLTPYSPDNKRILLSRAQLPRKPNGGFPADCDLDLVSKIWSELDIEVA